MSPPAAPGGPGTCGSRSEGGEGPEAGTSPVCICKYSHGGPFWQPWFDPGWKNPCPFRPQPWEPVWQTPARPRGAEPPTLHCPERAVGERARPAAASTLGLGCLLEESAWRCRGVSDIPAARQTVCARACDQARVFYASWVKNEDLYYNDSHINL